MRFSKEYSSLEILSYTALKCHYSSLLQKNAEVDSVQNRSKKPLQDPESCKSQREFLATYNVLAKST